MIGNGRPPPNSELPYDKGMPGRRLATFVHVSDTHIGDLDPRTGDAALGPDVLFRWKKDRHFYGFLGHTHVALAQLADFYRRLRDAEDARLIHTGDLTRWGGAAQFALAKKFFEKRLPTPAGDVGLDDPRALELAIPGNHDHWPGTGWVFGRASSALRRMFRPLPLPPKRIALPGGRCLVFAGIDTDADVWPWSPSRALARGAFLSQLRSLARLLKPREPHEIRVLLLHHSPAHRKAGLGMQRRSRRALDAFVARHGFRVMLTGHIHVPGGRIRRMPHGDLLEARAGATLLRDFLPREWLEEGGGPTRPLPQNALLVHRLIEAEDGSVEWRTALHLRTPGGFEERGPMEGAEGVSVWEDE